MVLGTTYQIERPKDLPPATTLHDSDILIIDQGASGVKRIPVSYIRSVFSGTNQFASNLVGDEVPTMPAPLGTIYLRITDTNQQWWVNSNCTNGTGWQLWGQNVPNSKPLNVREYPFSAAGNGVTDDTTAIQNAINVASASTPPGKVYMPSGVYPISRTLVITNSIELVGDGTGKMEDRLNDQPTRIQKTANFLAIKLQGHHHITLKDFCVRGYRGSGDTTGGIQIGSSETWDDAAYAFLANITVQACGADGIWLQNANCCNLDVAVGYNAGHGLRMESTVVAYYNVNKCTVVVTATGNGGDGLHIEGSEINVINVTSQGNYGWGIYDNWPGNIITCYTEGNVLGSCYLGPSSFRTDIKGKFVDGEPTIVNPASIITSNTQTNEWIGLYYNLRLNNSTGDTLVNTTTDDGTNKLQVAGSVKVMGKVIAWDDVIAPKLRLDSDWAEMAANGAFVSQSPFLGNWADGVTFYGNLGTNDSVLGQLVLTIGGHAEDTIPKRYGVIQVGDGDWWRTLLLNPHGNAFGGWVGIDTTNCTAALTVGGDAHINGYVRIPNNTWFSGVSAADPALLVPEIGVDSAGQISIAPEHQPTTIGGPVRMGNTNLITADVPILVPGGGTNTLRFVNGGLFEVLNH